MQRDAYFEVQGASVSARRRDSAGRPCVCVGQGIIYLLSGKKKDEKEDDEEERKLKLE